MTEPIEMMDIAQFRAEGYLQEVNRRFLHPLGLALEITQEDDGTERLSGVWDYRDDPEGISYDVIGLADSRRRFESVEREWSSRRQAREEALGYWVQPVGDVGGEP